MVLELPEDEISIHTPAKGVTICIRLILLDFSHFNPHSREGSDRETVQEIYRPDISIHTPAKGVTAGPAGPAGAKGISIHTPAKGVTTYTGNMREIFLFQSTLPRRE